MNKRQKKIKMWYIVRKLNGKRWTAFELTESEYNQIDNKHFESKGPYESLIIAWMAANKK